MSWLVENVTLVIIMNQTLFCSGGMAPSEWARIIRAVRDTPVANPLTPGLNSTRRIVYRPAIVVSLFLCVLSVSYLKRWLWHCGQLSQYVSMGWLGMRLNQDCNAMGNAANISPRVPSTWAHHPIFPLFSIPIISSYKIYVAINNPSLVASITCLTTSCYLWNYVCAADNISYADNLQSKGYRFFAHF